MVVIEYCTKKAIEGRKTHKSKQILFDLKNEKDIAFEEFQIEKIKTGHKEISDLNNTIETLNSQIEAMNTQNKLSTDNYKLLLESSNANEEKLQNIVNEVREDYNKERAKIKSLIKLSGLEELLTLSKDERGYFFEFCNYRFLSITTQHIYNDKLVEKFEKLDLISHITNKNGIIDYTLHPLGQRFYDYLIENKNTI